MIQNLWTAEKAVLRGNFIEYNPTSIKISNKHPSLTPKAIRKGSTLLKKKVSRRKEIMKIMAEINGKEMKKTTAKINETESCFSEKINKLDKPSARLPKENRSDSNQ